jgi:hypothetical protein
VRRNLFWKLSLTFLALLLSVLLAMDFFAERALRNDYRRASFTRLAAIAHLAQASPPQLPPTPPSTPEDSAALRNWVAQIAAGSGLR